MSVLGTTKTTSIRNEEKISDGQKRGAATIPWRIYDVRVVTMVTGLSPSWSRRSRRIANQAAGRSNDIVPYGLYRLSPSLLIPVYFISLVFVRGPVAFPEGGRRKERSRTPLCMFSSRLAGDVYLHNRAIVRALRRELSHRTIVLARLSAVYLGIVYTIVELVQKRARNVGYRSNRIESVT